MLESVQFHIIDRAWLHQHQDQFPEVHQEAGHQHHKILKLKGKSLKENCLLKFFPLPQKSFENPVLNVLENLHCKK